MKSRNISTMATITITFGDVAENHAKMEKIGNLAASGLSAGDLAEIRNKAAAAGFTCEMIDLAATLLPDDFRAKNAADYASAKVLIIREFSPDYMPQLQALDWDTKAFMYGRVVNKKARHNLCFADTSAEPDYENKRGRVIAFSQVPALEDLRRRIGELLPAKLSGLVAEGNLYYDATCGIGYHGDAERKKVVAFRYGAKIPLTYRWYLDGNAVSDKISLDINPRDVYFMGEKATGDDWKRKKIPTLRHAAGAKKYTD